MRRPCVVHASVAQRLSRSAIVNLRGGRRGVVRTLMILALTALAAGCRVGPPAALAGLWSAGPAACEAGFGLEFGERSVDAVYPGHREILFANARYEVVSRDDPFRVRIRYDLAAPGRPPAEGVLELVERGDGWLRPVRQSVEDKLTGAVRIPINPEASATALTVRSCAPNAWMGELRGRRS